MFSQKCRNVDRVEKGSSGNEESFRIPDEHVSGMCFTLPTSQ